MNYLGHAALAAEESPAAAFVLGAMLPDLASMLRLRGAEARLQGLEHPQLRAGVEHHHDLDAVFHECSTFIELNRVALAELRELGVARGPARAVAHIGTEMMLDAVLARSPAVERPYLAALRLAHADPAVLPGEPPLPSELAALAGHIASLGVEHHALAPPRIVERLHRALSGRARLEPSAAELPLLLQVCEVHAPRVERATPHLLDELRSQLAPRRANAPRWSPPG